MRFNIIMTVWAVFVVSLVGYMGIKNSIISRLKDVDENELIKAGNPSRFLSDHRSFKFMSYVLSQQYENVLDGNIVKQFRKARLFLLFTIGAMAIFFSLVLFEPTTTKVY